MRKIRFNASRILVISGASVVLLTAALFASSCCILHMPAKMLKKDHSKHGNNACSMHSSKTEHHEQTGAATSPEK